MSTHEKEHWNPTCRCTRFCHPPPKQGTFRLARSERHGWCLSGCSSRRAAWVFRRTQGPLRCRWPLWTISAHIHLHVTGTQRKPHVRSHSHRSLLLRRQSEEKRAQGRMDRKERNRKYAQGSHRLTSSSSDESLSVRRDIATVDLEVLPFTCNRTGKCQQRRSMQKSLSRRMFCKGRQAHAFFFFFLSEFNNKYLHASARPA